MENNRKTKLINFSKHCENANLLNQQIQELETDIIKIEKLFDNIDALNIKFDSEKYLLKELQNLRIKKISLELDLNILERKMLQFQLEEELCEY